MSTGADGGQVPDHLCELNILGVVHYIVGDEGLDLKLVTTITLETLIFPVPTPYLEILSGFADKLKKVTDVMGKVLALFTSVCSSLLSLRVVGPDVLNIIPQPPHCSQLRHLSLGLHDFKAAAPSIPEQIPPDNVLSLLAGLHSLTLLPSSAEVPALSCSSLSACTSLYSLDYGSFATTEEFWVVLPDSLVELRCKLGEPPRFSSSSRRLRHLKTCVLEQWGRRECVRSFLQVLGTALNLRSVVLRQAAPAHPSSPARVTAYLFCRDEFTMIELLQHKGLSCGLELLSESWNDALHHNDLVQPARRDVQLQISEDANDGNADAVTLNECMEQAQPLPYFKDVVLFARDLDLARLHTFLPNLSMLVVGTVTSPDQVAPLSHCASLHTLELFIEGNLCIADLCENISRLRSLQHLTLHVRAFSTDITRVECVALQQLLLLSRPDVLVTIL